MATLSPTESDAMKVLLHAVVLASVWVAVPVVPTAADAEDTLTTVADADRGERAFRQCSSCHSFDPNRRMQGSHLVGLIGRTAGTVEGVRFSRAMRESGIVWTEETLTAYLVDPRGFLPGTTMVQRIRNADDIPDLLAYIIREGSAPEAR